MKDSTRIWESSNRPLFVRTVWLESLGRTSSKLRRHFLLDYDSQKIWRKAKERPKSQYDNRYWVQCCDDYEHDDFYGRNKHQRLLLDSAKAKLHEPIEQRLRHIGSNRTPNGNLHQLVVQQQKCCSRCSSLQNLLPPSTNEVAAAYTDERLVERVLNWLDLAKAAEHSKTQLAYRPQSPKQKRSKLCSGLKFRADLMSNNRKALTGTKPSCKHHHAHPKNINKEEVPIPSFKLPVDSNASSNSLNRSLNRDNSGNSKSEKIKKSQKRCGLSRELTNFMLRKHFQNVCDEEILNPLALRQTALNPTVEARKQLHIFMPTIAQRRMDANDCSYD